MPALSEEGNREALLDKERFAHCSLSQKNGGTGLKSGVRCEDENQENIRPDRTIAQELPSKDNPAAQSNSEKGVHVILLDDSELAFFNDLKDRAARLTVLGRLTTVSPGFAALKDWARSTLHESFDDCALVGGGFFEARFKTEEGVIHTLSNVFFHAGKEVLFTPWNPSFNVDNADTFGSLEYPVWIQFLGLRMHLRNITCLKILASKIGRVLFVDDASNLAEKTAGPRVKILVPDYTQVPERIRIGPDGSMDHKILVTGYPAHCLRCREPGHSAKSCSKKLDQEHTRVPYRAHNTSKPFREHFRNFETRDRYRNHQQHQTRPVWRGKPKNKQPIDTAPEPPRSQNNLERSKGSLSLRDNPTKNDLGFKDKPSVEGRQISNQKELSREIEMKDKSPSRSETASSAKVKTTNQRENVPDISEDLQFPTLSSSASPKRRNIPSLPEDKTPQRPEGISPQVLPKRLPPEIVFTFGSHPPQKTNPPTPVRNKERKAFKTGTVQSVRKIGESIHPTHDSGPLVPVSNDTQEKAEREFVWNPRVHASKRKGDDAGDMEFQPKRSHRSSEIPQTF